MSDRLTAPQWSVYWEKGSITTFLGRFNDNYDGEVQQFWHKIFAGLAQGAQIVDLATGNGALALLARQYAHRNGVDYGVTGVDYAAIDPLRQFADQPAYRRHLRRIRFLPKTRIEQTGLPGASYDLVMSQFGVEYGDPDGTANEIIRLVRPDGGRFAALMHHESSAIVKQARDGIRQVVLCEKSGVTRLVTNILERLERLAGTGRKPDADRQSETLRAQLNEALGKLDAAAKQFADPNQIAFYVNQSMAPFNSRHAGMTTADKKHGVAVVADETRAYKQRMRDLVSAACDDERIDAFTRRLSQAGFAVETSAPFHLEGVHFAHQLVAGRSS